LFSIIKVSSERTTAVIKQDLSTLIEKKRAELIQVAVTSGLTSSIAIRYSQELDHLLNEYKVPVPQTDTGRRGEKVEIESMG
jgi:hypothetical protein